jgi:hypothetical protein
MENLKSNASFAREEKRLTLTDEQYIERAFKSLDEYAEAHKKLPVHNAAQKYARDAAVDLGKRDFTSALWNLRQLRKHLGSVEEWVEFAREGIER